MTVTLDDFGVQGATFIKAVGFQYDHAERVMLEANRGSNGRLYGRKPAHPDVSCAVSCIGGKMVGARFMQSCLDIMLDQQLVRG